MPSVPASARIELNTSSEFRKASLLRPPPSAARWGTASSRCGDWITRRDYFGHQLPLREVFSVQGGDKRGVPLLCARAKCVIGRIWRYVIFGPNVDELRSSNPES